MNFATIPITKEELAALAFAKKIPLIYLEKDFYVSLLLRVLTSADPHLVFKGGTSLSKCFSAIQRFSEDVDLGLDYFPVSEGRRKNLRREVESSIRSLGLSVSNPEQIRSRGYYNRYIIPYSSIFSSEISLSRTILVETAIFSKPYPIICKKASTLIGDLLVEEGKEDLAKELGLTPFEVKTQALERTMVDKMFALCDYFLLNDPTRRRDSRHLYDLYKLYPLVDIGLVKRLIPLVKEDRKTDKHCLSAQEGQSLGIVLRKITQTDFFRQDYENVTAKLLYEKIDYSSCIDSLKTLLVKLDF